MRMVWNAVVTLVSGALAYGLAALLAEDHPWRLAIAVFTGGVVLIAAMLFDVDERTRAATRLMTTAQSANSLLTKAEASFGGDSLSHLIEAAARIDGRRPGQVRFADRQVQRLTVLLQGLHAGQVEHHGDLDWRAGLTDSAMAEIDLVSLGAPAGDPGDVRQALKRGVRVRQAFLINTRETADLDELLRPYREAGIELRVLRSDDFDFLIEGALSGFALFDGQLSYEVRGAEVTVVADENRVAVRQRRFEEIWDAAEHV